MTPIERAEFFTELMRKQDDPGGPCVGSQG